MWKIWIQNQTVFYVMYSTSPPTLRLACLLILILLEISFSHGRVTLAFPTLLRCFHTQACESSCDFWKEDGTAFLCYYHCCNELETFFSLGVEGRRKLHKILLLFIRQMLGTHIAKSLAIKGVTHRRGTGFVPTTLGTMHVCPRLGRYWWLWWWLL